MEAITLTDVGYRYPGSEVWAFRHLSLALAGGEVVRVAGRNGTGKTTLLKIVSGIFNVTEGGLRRNPETRTAYMNQSAGDMLALDMTVLEQLKLAYASTESNAPTQALLASFGIGLEFRLDEFIGHLSGGQRQVVALVVTIAGGANLLCLDEFTSSMDDRSAAVAGDIITKTCMSAGASVLVVGHSRLPLAVNRTFRMGDESASNDL